MVTSGGMQSVRQELCLQCEKTVAPDAVLSIEVKDDHGKEHDVATLIKSMHQTGGEPLYKFAK